MLSLAGSPTALTRKPTKVLWKEEPQLVCWGHGLDFHYPKSTLLLRKRIEEKGFVITWYKPDQGPRKAFFRERNWLIAALSDFIVVVEAPVKSGALITASFALQMGKEVKAVPGDIDRDSCYGQQHANLRWSRAHTGYSQGH